MSVKMDAWSSAFCVPSVPRSELSGSPRRPCNEDRAGRRWCQCGFAKARPRRAKSIAPCSCKVRHDLATLHDNAMLPWMIKMWRPWMRVTRPHRSRAGLLAGSGRRQCRTAAQGCSLAAGANLRAQRHCFDPLPGDTASLKLAYIVKMDGGGLLAVRPVRGGCK